MPAARLSETILLARESGPEVAHNLSPDSTDYRISPPIILAIIICSVLAFILAGAMAFFFLWRSDRKAKRTPAAASEPYIDPLDRYTQPPRRQDEKRSKRKWSYSSSTSGASSNLDALDSLPVLPSTTQTDAVPLYASPTLATLPLTRTTSTPSMYSVSSTTGPPVRGPPPPNNRRRSSSSFINSLTSSLAARRHGRKPHASHSPCLFALLHPRPRCRAERCETV